MCGIIGYIGSDNPKGILLDGLKRLEYRGYDSAGVAVLERDRFSLFRSEGRIQRLEEKLLDAIFDGTVGVGHTRWATHGAPTEINAHPHHVGAITLVHNGIVENYMDHREALEYMGRAIASETDSEIVAHLFDLEVQQGRGLAQALTSVLPRLRGSYAFVLLNKQEPDLIVGVRNGAPLVVGVKDGEYFLASDVQAILHRTKEIVYLQDGQFVLCRRSGISVHDFTGREVPFETKHISWSPDQMEKAGYRHYMLKEIHEQPQAITNTIEGNIDHDNGVVRLQSFEVAEKLLEGVKNISVVACGTARHAGLIGKYYLEKFTRLPVEVDFASEFRYRDPVLDPSTLLVLISQSGETADTLAALREGKRRGIRTIAICNVRESTLTREADLTLYTNAGPEIGVASTKAFTTQLVVLYMLAVHIGHANGTLPREKARTLTNDLLRLPLLVDRALLSEQRLEQIAEALQPSTFFFFMGRDVNYPVALEGALKLKEISYAHAEGYPAGELKHGPIALIDRHTAIMVLAPHDKDSGAETLYEKVMSNLQEVKSRGGKIFTLGSEVDAKLAASSHYHVALPDAPWALNPILMSIPMQLLAYYTALQRGTDVDKPRNLAKSVTVE